MSNPESSVGSDGGEQPGERWRDTIEIERLDEHACVARLPPRARADEPPQLSLDASRPLCGLLLEDPERGELALVVDHPFHGRGAERADELVLEIALADEEAEPLELLPGLPDVEPRPLERTPVVAFLTCIAEPRQPDPMPAFAEQREKRADPLRASELHDLHALLVEVAAQPSCQRLDRNPVALTLDEYERARGGHAETMRQRVLSHRSHHAHGNHVQGRRHSSRREADMTMTQYYTATSLDGFIADEHHSLDWLFKCKQDRAGPLNYAEFIAGVGALAMGSTTYEWILEHEFAGKDPADWRWPYDQPTWVFTHRDLAVVPDARIEFTSDDVAEMHRRLVEAAGGRNVWIVGGGDLVGQFADAGLLDEVIVYIAPVTLGAGAPLLPRRLDLRLDVLAQNEDFACARYGVVRGEVTGQD